MIIRIFSILLTVNKLENLYNNNIDNWYTKYLINSATNWINVNPEVSADVHK